MTTTTHLEEALAQFSCGPGGHLPNAGLQLGSFGTDVGWIRMCEACAKPDDPAACLFCDRLAARPGGQPPLTYTVEGPGGREATGGLCSGCYREIGESGFAGWRIAHD